MEFELTTPAALLEDLYADRATRHLAVKAAKEWSSDTELRLSQQKTARRFIFRHHSDRHGAASGLLPQSRQDRDTRLPVFDLP